MRELRIVIGYQLVSCGFADPVRLLSLIQLVVFLCSWVVPLWVLILGHQLRFLILTEDHCLHRDRGYRIWVLLGMVCLTLCRAIV